MYVIPKITERSYDDLVFELQLRPDNIIDMYWNIANQDQNIFKYINQTYYYPNDEMSRELTACTIIYHLLNNNLAIGEELPPVDDGVAYNLELLMAENSENYDELVDKIDDKVFQRVLEQIHDTGTTLVEKITLKRSAAYVYLAMKQSLDYLEIVDEHRLDVFRNYLENIE